MSAALSSLNPREEEVVRQYFAINPEQKKHTYLEIGQDLNISVERVRQIVCKSLRKLKHPTRNHLLKPHLNATSINR